MKFFRVVSPEATVLVIQPTYYVKKIFRGPRHVLLTKLLIANFMNLPLEAVIETKDIYVYLSLPMVNLKGA